MEIHPGYTQQAAQDYLKANQIIPQAWSPLGRGSLTANSILSDLGEIHGKSSAQIALRFLLQEGIMPIVKSGNRDRMLQNMDIFDFEIDEENMSIIRNMPQSTWLGEHPDFNIPDKKSNINQ